MIWYLNLAPKSMLPLPHSTGDQHEKPFHPQRDVRSVCISDQSLSLLLMMQNAYLSGLKSLVTIIPGSMTRVSLGRSVLAKVYINQYFKHSWRYPETYRRVTALTNLLANQLLGPLLSLRVLLITRVDSWYNERHLEICFCVKASVLKWLFLLDSGSCEEGFYVVFDEDHNL
jgi:hypothetical protein